MLLRFGGVAFLARDGVGSSPEEVRSSESEVEKKTYGLSKIRFIALLNSSPL
jgi:hypothetical protein